MTTPDFNDLTSEIMRDVEVNFVFRQGRQDFQDEAMVALKGTVELSVGVRPQILRIPIVLPLTLLSARDLVQKLETTIAQAESRWHQIP